MYTKYDTDILKAYKKIVICEEKVDRMKIGNIEFVVGQDYEDSFGVFTVTGLYMNNSLGDPESSSNIMTMQYKSAKNKAGEKLMKFPPRNIVPADKARELERAGDKKTQKTLERINAKILSDEAKNINAFTLGYLAKNARISIHAGANGIPILKQDFKHVTKLDIDDFKGEGYWSGLEYNKRSYSIGIALPTIKSDEDLKILKLPEDNIKITNGEYNIYSTKYGWMLLSRGFLPGKNDQNYDRITANMSEEDKEDFYRGTQA